MGTRSEIRRLPYVQDRPRIILNDSEVASFRTIVEPLPYWKWIVYEAMMEEEYQIKASCLIIAHIAIGATNGIGIIETLLVKLQRKLAFGDRDKKLELLRAYDMILTWERVPEWESDNDWNLSPNNKNRHNSPLDTNKIHREGRKMTANTTKYFSFPAFQVASNRWELKWY